ncbi:Crp/Fnr family transcriptional regulator [Acidisoma cellulosilytica]|uniref:Crp/Fnr family transcriptional regulator n=1 Tax=Acidisoma cellulosilyticum TaxID=2802395 RepID=A0A963Z5A0_9PROT|nr:Crp/Fnr family transcriptional regulator [Acidisoma cellulosilyticum]MCB8882305.1 Crp/Fnr family transcriptional regulator [Acidisoma cellulosilyticum]
MATPTPQELAENALLSTLRENDRDRLVPHMLIFDLKAGDVLQRASDPVTETWFPCGSALASFIVSTSTSNDAVEVALIGREGAVGGIVSNGSLPSFSTATVRNAGKFLRIKTSALEHAKIDSLHLRHWFSRYSDCLLAQVFQTAACNAKHTITQRSAKWLIAAFRRTGSREFDMTQEQLAELLGVGRTFVTRTVSKLRAQGYIETRRGVFVVLNERGLADLSCRCTFAIENHFDTVMHGIYPAD